MVQKKWCAALAAAACSAQAQTSDEVKRLEERVQQLEQRVQESQAQASSRQQSESAFNPAVSAILNGVYSNLQQNPDTYRIHSFAPTMGEVAPPPRGFSLGESELGFSANVDHLFRGSLIAAIQPDNDSIGVEEGYIQTL